MITKMYIQNRDLKGGGAADQQHPLFELALVDSLTACMMGERVS